MFCLHPTLLTIIHFLNFFINFHFVIKQLLTFIFCTNTM
ncbi:YhfH family protein, partial [Bacillus anthracis]|nr:YhfH family protein [Bacillus anthracis]